jgi:hypothetical protein
MIAFFFDPLASKVLLSRDILAMIAVGCLFVRVQQFSKNGEQSQHKIFTA